MLWHQFFRVLRFFPRKALGTCLLHPDPNTDTLQLPRITPIALLCYKVADGQGSGHACVLKWQSTSLSRCTASITPLKMSQRCQQSQGRLVRITIGVAVFVLEASALSLASFHARDSKSQRANNIDFQQAGRRSHKLSVSACVTAIGFFQIGASCRHVYCMHG